MRCPKCGSGFESVRFDYVEVDRCTGCGGLWFDALEKEQLQDVRGAGGIDPGAKRIGRGFDQVRNIECPSCGEKMFTVADEKQRHIEYEFCPACCGTFFDAGEFRDLTEITVIERFRRMMEAWLAVR